MGKYRHTVTGKVSELPDDYARAIKALEPVEESTPVNIADCYTCGPAPESSGSTPTADEPFLYE